MKLNLLGTLFLLSGILCFHSQSYGGASLYPFTRASAEQAYESGTLQEALAAYQGLYQLTFSLTEEDVSRLNENSVLIEWDLMLLATRYSVLLIEAGKAEEASAVILEVLDHPSMTFPVDYLTSREKAAILFYQQAIVENEHDSWPKWYKTSDGSKIREFLDVYFK